MSQTHTVVDVARTSRNLMEYREANGLTRADVRRALNLYCMESVYAWENGDYLPKLEDFAALAKLYNTRICSLVVRQVDPETGEPVACRMHAGPGRTARRRQRGRRPLDGSAGDSIPFPAAENGSAAAGDSRICMFQPSGAPAMQTAEAAAEAGG